MKQKPRKYPSQPASVVVESGYDRQPEKAQSATDARSHPNQPATPADAQKASEDAAARNTPHHGTPDIASPEASHP